MQREGSSVKKIFITFIVAIFLWADIALSAPDILRSPIKFNILSTLHEVAVAIKDTGLTNALREFKYDISISGKDLIFFLS